MSKEIWLGPLLGNNRSRLIERGAEMVAANKADRFLYLAASHPLLELVTQGILDGVTNRGLWNELPVYLFRGFVRRLLSTAVDASGQTIPPSLPIDQDELPLERSLVSQILIRLSATGQLKAIGPLARREGCVNTIATLIGEIERAAKSSDEISEIVAARLADLAPTDAVAADIARQIDFDKEVALIYSTYADLLRRHKLTEADADQMRALAVLKGELDGEQLQLPWLANVELLVLDGFFDFTPVQGEILRQLIPRVPNVVVNLNHDERNPEIFRPFKDTIDHLAGIESFVTKTSTEAPAPAHGALANLRVNLFNPALTPPTVADEHAEQAAEIRYFECGDRDTEIRAIAKEIKQLVLREGYSLKDIGLVVRQRASYSETVARVLREESLPCNLESRVEVNDIPALRAALKLFAVLEDLTPDEPANPRVSELADLIKSEYFRLDQDALDALASQFEAQGLHLLAIEGQSPAELRETLRRQYRIGVWDADTLENTFAYVGSELHLSEWVKRADRLIRELPSAESTKELLNIETSEQARDPDEADQVENAETAKLEEKTVEKKRRPSRDVHPASIFWASLIINEFVSHLRAVPLVGNPAELRRALVMLLDQFNFREQVARPIRSEVSDRELPQALLNFNSLEALRRAFLAAGKSIEVAWSSLAPPSQTKLASYIEEVRRSLSSQTQLSAAADTRGLRVFEVTDVRGLRFRAVFIAGLVEGGFPLRASRDWIYPHEERERLKQYGLTLEDISPATLLKEEHYFYQAACRATERLYLTRPLVLQDDAETVASYYIDELRRAVAPLKIKAEPIRRDYDGRQLPWVSRTAELNIALVRQQERRIHHDTVDLLPQPRVKRLLTLARNDGFVSDSALRRIEIERERASREFGPYDGEITDPHLIALLNQRFGPDFVHSASGLSVYGNCAYRFFGQRVLKLEPRGEVALDLQAIDAGKLLHDILRRFFERHRRQPLHQIDRGVLQKELRDLADKVFDEHERVVPPLNKQIWKIDREIRKILLDQVLLYELEVQEKAAPRGVVPAYFEVAFGMKSTSVKDPGSKSEPLELSRATFVGEETMRISGQIDRVDAAADQTLIAYDYKLSTGSSKEDIKAGRSLQLPIYLEALEKLIFPNQPVAGGGYYVIRGGNERRNKGLHRASVAGYSGISTRAGAVISDDEWLQIRADVTAKVWNFLDGMRAGHFAVEPSEKKKTCRFCDFAAVCRYDQYRIERKKLSADYTDSTDVNSD
ncbi:MAG: PD-(D/E)XK nuclease family protein [Pyrinomonadaceae bacterium]